MISTDNIRMEKDETKFYLPLDFEQDLELLLRKNNIPYRNISFKLLQNDKTTCADRNMWAKRFRALPYTDTENIWVNINLMGCIVSHCNTDDLFDIVKQMTGPNMDTDFKNMKLLMQHEIEQEYCERYHTTLND